MAAVKNILIVFFACIFLQGWTQQPRLILPVGHSGKVEATFSPDGKKILTLGDDGTAKIWDANAGYMMADLMGHKTAINTAVFSPDGSRIITISDDNIIKVWSNTGDFLHTIEIGKEILSCFFHHDGQNLIVIFHHDLLTERSAWSLSSGKQLFTISESEIHLPDGKKGTAPPILAYSADGKLIALAEGFHASPDTMIIVLLDALTGKRLDTLEGIVPDFSSFEFSADGKFIAAQCRKSVARNGLYLMRWELSTRKLRQTFSSEEPIVQEYRFIQTISNKALIVILASDEENGLITTWDFSSGGQLHKIQVPDRRSVSYRFGPGNLTLLITNDKTHSTQLWNLLTGQAMTSTIHANEYVYGWQDQSKKLPAKNSKYFAAFDGTMLRIWDLSSGKQLHTLTHGAKIKSVEFTEKDKAVFVTDADNRAYIWDMASGKLIRSIRPAEDIGIIQLSPNLRYLAVTTKDSTKNRQEDDPTQIVSLWSMTTGDLSCSFEIKGDKIKIRFIPGSESLVVEYTIGENENPVSELRDIKTGKLLTDFRGKAAYINTAIFSPDANSILTTSNDPSARIWDARSGRLLFALKGHSGILHSAQFSSDGKQIITASDDSTAKVWDVATKALLRTLSGHGDAVIAARFSENGNYILTATEQDCNIWDATSGKLLRIIKGGGAADVRFSADSRHIVSNATIWDVQTGQRIFDLDWHNGAITSNSFSPDNNYVLTASEDATAKIWSTQYGEMLFSLDDHQEDVVFASFIDNGHQVITSSFDHTAKIWDARTGILERSIELGPNTVVKDIQPAKDRLLCLGSGTEIKLMQFSTGRVLYRLFAIDSTDNLVVDNFDHYDGTAGARKLLYFVCNNEVIELEQLKDRLWVPDLAARLNSNEKINAPRLSDLNICGLTPIVEEQLNKTGFQFKISPRKGGLGETILKVNGIEKRRYQPEALSKVKGGYTLYVSKDEMSRFFATGLSNEITVKSYTRQNDIASRGVIVNNKAAAISNTPPNLFAVVIGVSDYKGKELRLNYAAKDAIDIGHAITASAGKFLGSSHVFVYNLNTGAERYAFPEKKGIRSVFDSIATRASANDILVVFFAGHGVVKGDRRQFYFLTAEASGVMINDKDISNVSISASELMEWIKPDRIKAQKRIMIIDACHSGQAINDMKNMIAVRSDDKADEIKQIDKLNEKAGLYILAASASNQGAYELGRIDQGLLTYALLKAIREHPEALEQNKYLNVSGWFAAATKLVGEIVLESNLIQEPQLITTTNFNVGIVDDDVLAQIRLPKEKALFNGSNFQNNDPAIMDDDLLLSALVNKNLGNIAARGLASKFSFTTVASPNGWTLIGRYDITGDDVVVRVNMKQNNELKFKFELRGKKSKLQDLAEQLVNEATERVGH
jgi:WD40 repeat protein